MDRFWSKVDKSGDCWNWTAGKYPNGYGAITINGEKRGAHRVVLELEGIDIPSGMHVCHKCDNPGCVNPDHLFLGTHQDNVRDMREKERQARGSRHGQAKLCEADVDLIKELLKTKSQRQIAGWFNVCQQTISNINTGNRWAHL